jgi:hypothetical protein
MGYHQIVAMKKMMAQLHLVQAHVKGSYVWIFKNWVSEKEPYMDFWDSRNWNVIGQEEKCDLENL